MLKKLKKYVMTIQSMFKFVGNRIMDEADYITESGELITDKGVWNYEVWKSGRQRVYGRLSVNCSPTGSVLGGYYYIYQMEPPITFSKIYCVHADAYWGTGIALASTRTWTAEQINITLLNNQKEASKAVIAITIEGMR